MTHGQNIDAIPIPAPDGMDPRAIVEDYNRFKREVPLKLSSAEAEVVFGQADGAPARGWVVALAKVGKSLVARFGHVPFALCDRAEKTRLLFQPEYDGARLKTIAVSGAGFTPARTLEDFALALMSESPGESVHRLARTVAAERTLAYSEAVRHVIREHPDLGRRYLLRNG